LPEYSRSLISSWIKDEHVLLNKNKCKPKDKVQTGDSIELKVHFSPVETRSKPEDIPLNIVYEDEDVLVINKPAGLVVHPGAGNWQHTLVNALLHHLPSLEQLPRAGIVHRLDKDTTGLLIIAKNLIAHTDLVRQMQARDIQRNYVTLVQGHLISGATIDTNFGRHPRNRLKMAVLNQGRQAITQFTIKKQYQEFTLLDVQLMTGRTHQIRVHLSHLNHSVVGDQLYCPRIKFPADADESLLNIFKEFKRQALHASSLSFFHPISENDLTCTAPLPDDFQQLLNALDKHYESKTG
jgi:23S rRNA pseudouridine1911/1915/1917 synthase